MYSPLKDKWIVITRPKHQANKLRLMLEAEGANVILFPLLEIILPDNIALAKQKLANIQENDLAIFTSANAVEYSLKWLDKSKLKLLKITAIGKKTAKVLNDFDIDVDYFPQKGFNSEALLALPEIQNHAKNSKIVILRGQDGREFLKERLESDGAKVSYIDVYKRSVPEQNIAFLSRYFNQNKLDIILITSGTSLMNLFHFLPQSNGLRTVDLLVGSERIKKQALCYPEYQGALYSASDPSDETLFKKLLEWGEKTNQNG